MGRKAGIRIYPMVADRTGRLVVVWTESTFRRLPIQANGRQTTGKYEINNVRRKYRGREIDPDWHLARENDASIRKDPK